jgi:hypothetical protein
MIKIKTQEYVVILLIFFILICFIIFVVIFNAAFLFKQFGFALFTDSDYPFGNFKLFLGTDQLTWKGGGYGFLLRSEFFFSGQHES